MKLKKIIQKFLILKKLLNQQKKKLKKHKEYLKKNLKKNFF